MKIKIETIRHSLAHILAAAIREFFPEVKFGIGPAIENGFYYDFGGIKISEEDLLKIEKRMKELIKQNLVFKKKNISKTEAKKIFKNQPYKLELIKELANKNISVYQNGEFIDLCKGPHIKNTLQLYSGQAKEIIDSFKLTKIAGAYWKGSEKNPMLTRIYGLAFVTKKELDDYLQKQTEAEKRDHIILGQKLGLFMISNEVGQGLPIWLPKGALIRQILEDFIIKKYLKNGYEIVRTPHIGNEKLFSISGHLTNYKEGMYAPIKIEKEKYYLKPMNCPIHLIIYKNTPKSYRDLPVRYTELGTVYRYEKSGVLHGLTRVRGFTQDDGHIICRLDQLEEEIEKAIKLTKEILETFGFKEFRVALSVRDSKNKKKYLGSDKMWKMAETKLAKGIKNAGWNFKREEGEAVFYGPKMDIKVKDSLGREWQISTLQVDFNLPERFNINFINEKSEKERPFMLHRALLGSLERFFGLLIEHYAGALPLWLSPVQVEIINIGEAHRDYAEKIRSQLSENEIRAKLSDENLTVSKRIREAEIQKIPYILVVGDKELQNNSVNIRSRKGNEGETKLEAFIEKIKKEIQEKNGPDIKSGPRVDRL